jgi:hypothetical protein
MAVVLIAAAITASALVVAGVGVGSWLGVAALATIAVLVERGRIVAAATVAALVAEALDALFASFAFALRRLGSLTEALGQLMPVVVASVPLYSPAVALLVIAYREVSPWTLPLFFVPALAAQRWFLLYQEQQRLATDLSG